MLFLFDYGNYYIFSVYLYDFILCIRETYIKLKIVEIVLLKSILWYIVYFSHQLIRYYIIFLFTYATGCNSFYEGKYKISTKFKRDVREG